MAANDDAAVLSKIQDTYVPFLKKFIAFLEKNKKATPENLSKLKTIYTIFTTAPPREQVETFHANEKKLQTWYKKAQKDKNTADGETPKGTKRPFISSDTESSQGATEGNQTSAKKNCTFNNSVNSGSNHHSTSSIAANLHPSLIKKEKLSPVKAAQPTFIQSVVNSQPKPAPALAPAPAAAAPSGDDPIIFTCASCQFQTQEEAEFMKHARTDHRTDLSMWCKQCGKCFSNAGVLVSHIKERACIKEEMIYKCGVKDCVFETTSGQTFVHHLRHCHKGSPFIFCVHCQKIFTLPHCLILHMQDDCPFKDRNRRNPAGGAADGQSKPDSRPATPVTVPQAKLNPVSILQAQSGIRPQPTTVVSLAPRPVTPRPSPVVQASPVVRSPTPIPRTPAPIPRTPMMSVMSRGRGRGAVRGRGRGRGRSRISDSSDSDDPDDPNWRPDESLGETGLRRSGRMAKRMYDVHNPEPSTSGVTTSIAKKGFTSADVNEKLINCPCCDYTAVFQSVLEDHYLTNHKVPNKNACLVCHLKFESTRAFFDHFEQHRSGSLPNQLPSDVMNEPAQTQAPKPIEITEAVSVNAVSVSEPVVNKEMEPFDGVLTSIAGANLTDPATEKDKAVKIPYQAAIHDKNTKDSKLKRFEELKSPNDLITMKTIQKLKHFFKCGIYNCTFTTHVADEFSIHLKTRHEGKRYHCCYCLKEELNSDHMARHIAFKHNKRIYQCSKCFYRAYSKAHVQIHMKNSHSQDVYTEILVCDAVDLPDASYQEESTNEDVNTTWPYVCAIGPCNYSTYDPKEFKKHNETIHRLVSVFFCHYCKVDFLTFKRLMNHYRLHGLNVFQCNYCIHGAENKEEIMLHLSTSHADEPLKAYMRGSHEEASSEVKQLNSGVHEETDGMNISDVSSCKDVSIEGLSKDSPDNLYTGCENELYHVIDNQCYPKNMQSMCYPRYLKRLASDLICGIPFCNEKFETIQLYLTHLTTAHDAVNYPCPHCPEVCSTWGIFKNHLLCHGAKLYACGTDDCEFYDCNKEKVKEHKKVHDANDDSVIAIREFSPNDEEVKLFSLNNKEEFPDAEDAFTCLFCKYKCSDRNTMKNHMYKEMAYQRFDCSLCEKKCSSQNDIKEHFTTAHPELDILCSADYNIEIEMRVKSVLSNQEKFREVSPAETCDMCCRKFKNPLRLQSHLYVCLQKEYRPYECTHCSKSFVNLLALKYHTDEHHPLKDIEYSALSNSAIEEDIEKNLLKIRLKQLKDIFEELSVEVDVDEKNFKVKFYTCSDCAFEAYHKYNLERHNQLKHEGSAKVIIGRECNVNSGDNSLSVQLDENSNDSTSGKTAVKRYSCGYCIKKMVTIQEVEKHMRKAHVSKNTEFFYYYNPSTKSVEADKDIYECAYCKSTRENLFSLQKHASLMHSEMEFKVKGFLSSTQSQNNYLACGYCYLKAGSHSQLQSHSAAVHPLLALKSIGGFQVHKAKRSIETPDDCPNKRVKFSSIVFVCSHCGGAFSSLEAVTAHSQKAHSRFELKYTKMDQSASSAESTDLRFYKCEFCRFTSEKPFLDKHIATKHKMRVTCAYCNKRFEYASKLKEHHDVFHKGLPIKYSQETLNLNTSSCDSNLSSSSDKIEENKSAVIPESVTRYGKKPEPIDLNSLTVHMKTSQGDLADLPLVYVTERFNLFPKVVLEDYRKKENSV